MMNLSLKNRMFMCFLIATVVVIVSGLTTYFYLDSLNKDIGGVVKKSENIDSIMFDIRIATVSILKYQRRILSNNALPADVERLVDLSDELTAQLEKLKSFYDNVEIREIISRMSSYVDSLKLTLSKASLFHRDRLGMTSIGDLADKILDSYAEFQDIQNVQLRSRDKEIDKIIEHTKRNMLTTIMITFFGTILLGLAIPGKIALPFKKINDAIRELQNSNFEVSIYYNQNDEIGEIATEMNRMILNMKKFEELRADRISVELRKFDALADMVKKNVLVANSSGQLVYMNNQLYSLLQLKSDDVIGKNITDALIPVSIKDAYELAIKRQSKIENAEIVIPCRKEEVEDGIPVKDFTGYANVLPIRGKDSSLDYYLMVLSEDIFV